MGPADRGQHGEDRRHAGGERGVRDFGRAGGYVRERDRPSHVAVWVRTLPERQRVAVFLRYWADLDYRPIADVLEVEVGTVSATLSAAHQSLRRSVQEVR